MSDVAKIESNIRRFHDSFSAGTYSEAIDMMAPGMTAYTPFGGLNVSPASSEDSLKLTQDLHAAGARLKLSAKKIEVKVYNDSAVATFIAEGTGAAAGGASSVPVKRRVSQFWKKEGGTWQIAHIHASNFQEANRSQTSQDIDL